MERTAAARTRDAPRRRAAVTMEQQLPHEVVEQELEMQEAAKIEEHR